MAVARAIASAASAVAAPAAALGRQVRLLGIAIACALSPALPASDADARAAGAATRAEADAATHAAPTFSEDEVARILALGPWPPGPDGAPRDPSNRVSGNADAAALGRALFFDPRLSANGGVSCASCHLPVRGFTDGRTRAQGLGLHDRNTQGLLDVAWQRWFGRDGGADSLWAAAVRPMLAAHEMGASPATIARVVRSDPDLARRHRALFGAQPDDETLMVDLAKAIAAYMETLVSPATPFDAFRDALARGDPQAAARYPLAARRGLKIFIGRGNCTACHFGPLFTNGEFHDIGVPFVVERGRVDPGRFSGIRRLQADPYNLESRFNDQRDGGDGLADAALKTRTVKLQQRNFGEWKVPGLRNLRVTGPYMHDGSKATLRDVVRHYSELNEDRLHTDGEAILRPLHLSESEIGDLVAFLESLSP